METSEGMNVYIIRSGQHMKKTFIIASNMEDAIKKFFNTFSDIRDAAVKNEISQKFSVETGKIKNEYSSLPFLILLGAISKEEAVRSLMRYVNNRTICEIEIERGIQLCQWIKS